MDAPEAQPGRPQATASLVPRSWRLLALGLILIPLWQCSFLWVHPSSLPSDYYCWAATGLHQESRFVYFLYYLNLFPVATELPDRVLVYSRDGANRVFEKHGDTLVMELGHTLRFGDLGRTLLFLPAAWLKGSPEVPSVRPCNAAAFIFALMALFASAWWVGRPVLGAILVILLGSNPFQIFEVYVNGNIFGWSITAAMLVLALHWPLLGFRKPRGGYVWAVPVLTGLLLATIRQVRTEPAFIALSALAAYLTMSGVRWPKRLALAGLLIATMMGTGRAWSAYFDAKFRQAAQRVGAAGGHPYTGPRNLYHATWFSLWCGLGDFDTKYGYQWLDVAAGLYAMPILKQMGVDVPPWDGSTHVFQTYWDDARKYYKTPYELPHYEDVLRDKVLHDIRHDPLWYLDILLRRLWRILWETTPASLGIGPARLSMPFPGLIFLPVVGFLLWVRNWPLVKLACFLLPLSLIAFVIFSDRGTCWYSCYHLVPAAILLTWLAQWAMARLRRRTNG